MPAPNHLHTAACENPVLRRSAGAAMTVRTSIGAVIDLLETPELWSIAASSSAVRQALHGMLVQVNEEIAMLAPLLEQPHIADRERLVSGVDGRRAIVERLQTLLIACGGSVDAGKR